ncbi:hypothetical protein [Subtercola endophyticus]|uniref:hypothetical protein n=1 Tax=Subtercola endophyticus TaxID=2895559 RepID=UPI001E3CD924|nr:hypothetical protein [Subtercola endophyticus]UFS59102.1 hypothetical protein LQ955_19340 [Subtercola endophyticus]
MRTTDFSKAPKQAGARALVVVEFGAAAGARSGVLVGRAARENREQDGNSGVFGMNTGTPWFSRQSAKASGEIPSAPGYVWHKTFWRGPKHGAIVFFDTVANAEAYRDAASSFSESTRLLVAEPSGYSNGVWRAEGNVMAHIEHFTPTSVEAARGTTPPLVATPAVPEHPHRAADSGGSRRSAPAQTRSSTAAAAAAAAAKPAPARAGTTTSTAVGEDGRPVTDATAMFVGATKYRGPRALLTLSRTWYPMVARLQTLHGYVWHTVYWQPPFTLGTLAFFATRDDLLAFARLPAHRALMQWITRDTKNGTGGYIRLHTAPPVPEASGEVDP